MRRSRLALGLVALSLPLALAAPAGAAVGTAKAPAYAKSVCSKIADWRDTIEQAADQAASADATSAKAAKKTLLKMMTRSFDATKKLVSGLKKSGSPNVDGGKEVASIMREGFTQVRTQFAVARTNLKSAPTDDVAAFQSAARGAEDALEAGLEHVQQALRAATVIDVPELVEAFNAESSCADVTA